MSKSKHDEECEDGTMKKLCPQCRKDYDDAVERGQMTSKEVIQNATQSERKGAETKCKDWQVY